MDFAAVLRQQGAHIKILSLETLPCEKLFSNVTWCLSGINIFNNLGNEKDPSIILELMSFVLF